MIRGLLLLASVLTLLTGCVSETVKSTSVPVLDAPTTLAPEAELLDVGVVILDPGISAVEDEEQVYPEVRRAEATFMATELAEVLTEQGGWGAVRVVTLNNYHERFKDMRVCFAHGGQLAQINLGRRIQGFDGRPDLFEGKTHPRKAVAHPNIFFDTLVHDCDSLELMIRRNGTDQIILGLDDPYPLGEMESERQSSYPGKLLDLALERNIINEDQYQDIWGDNVLRWLGGERSKYIRQIIKTKNAV